MVKFDKHTSRKTGITKTQVRVTQEVKGENGKYTKVTVKNFGYLEDQKDQDKFMEEVRRFDKEFHQGKTILFDINPDTKINDSSNYSFNFGYRYLEAIYDALEIDQFIDTQKTRTTYNLRDIFKYDVLMRILSPGSKRSTFQLKDCLYDGSYGFHLHQNYRALSYFANFQDLLFRHLNAKVKELIGRDAGYAFYDCTNYYFEIDFPDDNGIRQNGVSKEQRTQPIIQLGLFIDSNAIPITMSVFPGNKSDSLTLRPCMQEVKNNYKINRLIIVGDKGFNTTKNIDQIINNGDGYVFSLKLRGSGKTRPKYQDKCFETEGWIGDENFKYTCFEDYYESKGLNNKEGKVKRKILIYYKKELADLEKARRKARIDKVIKGINNGTLKMRSGLHKYVSEKNIISETGEIADEKKYEIDMSAFEEEAKLDGYFALVTSEIDYDYKKMLEVYGQLWMVEDSFRITKSDLELRPIFVSTEEHIKGYFVETFVSLMIIRLMQYKMGTNKISAQRIIEVLNMCNCQEFIANVIHIDRIGGRNAFFYKKNKEGKEKSTLELVKDVIYESSKNNNEIKKGIFDQIESDYEKIRKAFNVDEINMWIKKKDFNNYLESIKFSTISLINKRKPGRPKSKKS